MYCARAKVCLSKNNLAPQRWKKVCENKFNLNIQELKKRVLVRNCIVYVQCIEYVKTIFCWSKLITTFNYRNLDKCITKRSAVLKNIKFYIEIYTNVSFPRNKDKGCSKECTMYIYQSFIILSISFSNI